MKTIVCKLDGTTYKIKSHVEPNRVKLSVQEILEYQHTKNRTRNTLFYAQFFPGSLIRYFKDHTQASEVCTRHYNQQKVVAVIGDQLFKIEHSKSQRLATF